MKIPAWLTFKVLAWTVAALLTVIAGQVLERTVTVAWLKGRVALAQGARDTAAADAKVAAGRAATAEAKILELAQANAGFAANEAVLRAELEHCQMEFQRIREENGAALLQAQRDRADAERTLEQFVARFAARTPSCAAALASLDRACPALGSY